MLNLRSKLIVAFALSVFMLEALASSIPVREPTMLLIPASVGLSTPHSSNKKMILAENVSDENIFRSANGDRVQPFTNEPLRKMPITRDEKNREQSSVEMLSLPVTERGNPALASENALAIHSADDEILNLLRESDQSFAKSVIVLPSDVNVGGARAQHSLSLEETLALALQNSYSYAASNARVEGAKYAQKAALGQLGPTIDLRGQRGREYSAPASFIDSSTGQAAMSDTHIRWDSSVIIRQPIFNPVSYFDYRKQEKLADSADMRKEDAREALYYEAIKAYYDLLLGYADLTFAQSYTERMNSLLDYMNKRLQGGGASNVDYERVRGRALTAKSAMIEAQGVLESAMVTLAQLTGVSAQKIILPMRMMPEVPASSRIALEHIREDNPAVRAARMDASAVKDELKSARARFSPTLSLELTQARSSNAGGDPILTTDRRYMFVVNMNLLNGGSDYYYQNEIGSKFVEKSNVASDIERKLKQQIEINYRTLDAVKRRIVVARQAYQTNSGVADVFLEQMTAGNKQLLDVLDAYQQAYQSRLELAQLLFLQADISYQILRNTGSASAFADTLRTP